MHEHTEDPREEIAELIRSVEAPAPAHLHQRVSEMVAAAEHRPAGATRGPSGLRLRFGAGLTAAAAALAALVLALTGGSGATTLSLAQASAVTLLPATMAAPREDQSDRSDLLAGVDGVSFPYWSERFGWRSTGARVDRVDGLRFQTVFYGDAHGHTVGYAIVEGTSAPRLADAGRTTKRGGKRFWVGHAGGAEVVTWIRDGHLCIVSGRGVDASTLLALASWDEHGDSA